MSAKKKTDKVVAEAEASPTVITLVLPVDKTKPATVTVRNGDLGHLSSFAYDDFKDICTALNDGMRAFVGVQANPPKDIQSAKPVAKKTSKKASKKKAKAKGKAPYRLQDASGQTRTLSKMLDPFELQEKYHFNENYVSQYFAFLERIISGDWGLSFASGANVFNHIVDLFPATLELSLYALIISVIVGVPAGIIASAYYKKWPDKLINSSTLAGYSMPVFWLALLLIMVFSLQLGWFPMSGRMGLLYEIEPITGFILIAIILGGFP